MIKNSSQRYTLLCNITQYYKTARKGAVLFAAYSTLRKIFAIVQLHFIDNNQNFMLTQPISLM